eukprot:TRINITY_DN17263_c0_g1_i1.p1 TRINITY_DN17263_c0_g1~~TRINITY_DN17263_c0_g1_i1.p1  ORF type:complete len:525 (+),score=135.51 TRINITY_DN17263_c0_g1_i1:59-1633(+)
MSVEDFLRDVLPEVREDVLAKFEAEGVKTAGDVLLCDKSDLKQIGLNMMEANRIIHWKETHGVHYPPVPKPGAAAAARRRRSRSRSGGRVHRSRSGSDGRPRFRRRSSSGSISSAINTFVREVSPGAQGEISRRLKFLPKRAAREVMRRDLNTAQNATAVVFSRLKEAEGRGRRMDLPRARPGRNVARQITDFVAFWRLEEQAERALLHLHPDGAREVIGGPALGSARNPTAVVLARCKDALRVYGRSAPEDSAARAYEPSPPRGRPVHRRQRSRSTSSGLLRVRSRSRSGGHDIRSDIRRFAEKHVAADAQDRVIRELEAMAPSSARQVMDRDLRSARKPTAVVLQRLKEVRSSQSLSDFACIHRLNDDACRALEQLSPAQRAWVMAKDLSSARDTTAVILSRCGESMRKTPEQLRIGAEGSPPRARYRRSRSRSESGSRSRSPGRVKVTVRRDDNKALVGIEFDDGSLRIKAVKRWSAADDAGLKPGHVVEEFNDEPVSTLSEVQSLVRKETTFDLTVRRSR